MCMYRTHETIIFNASLVLLAAFFQRFCERGRVRSGHAEHEQVACELSTGARARPRLLQNPTDDGSRTSALLTRCYIKTFNTVSTQSMVASDNCVQLNLGNQPTGVTNDILSCSTVPCYGINQYTRSRYSIRFVVQFFNVNI